ncbi:uncharacterized protein LOC110036881 [Phalaenopsis equestris]|uniref:uncharacterized protein LOC110036881 n=1 Tax=Phalaenopsis equestris TaxID=78828 RepID=UPI0009E634D6|nr:uncharacterized protein LOC110036881 [Phalaenopsis equestris]
MVWLKNPCLFSNVITGVGSFWQRGTYRCLNNLRCSQKMIEGGDYDRMHGFGYAAFAEHPVLGIDCIGLLPGSNSGLRMLKLQHDSNIHCNQLKKLSTISHRLGNSIRQEHSLSREWLAKRWAEEKRREDIMRKRKRRYAQSVEFKQPMPDTDIKLPFLQSFFTRTIPAEQVRQTNEASMQPPITQYEEGFLCSQTPEEANMNFFIIIIAFTYTTCASILLHAFLNVCVDGLLSH